MNRLKEEQDLFVRSLRLPVLVRVALATLTASEELRLDDVAEAMREAVEFGKRVLSEDAALRGGLVGPGGEARPDQGRARTDAVRAVTRLERALLAELEIEDAPWREPAQALLELTRRYKGDARRKDADRLVGHVDEMLTVAKQKTFEGLVSGSRGVSAALVHLELRRDALSKAVLFGRGTTPGEIRAKTRKLVELVEVGLGLGRVRTAQDPAARDVLFRAVREANAEHHTELVATRHARQKAREQGAAPSTKKASAAKPKTTPDARPADTAKPSGTSVTAGAVKPTTSTPAPAEVTADAPTAVVPGDGATPVADAPPAGDATPTTLATSSPGAGTTTGEGAGAAENAQGLDAAGSTSG
jgi:hypothetical protein